MNTKDVLKQLDAVRKDVEDVDKKGTIYLASQDKAQKSMKKLSDMLAETDVMKDSADGE